MIASYTDQRCAGAESGGLRHCDDSPGDIVICLFAYETYNYGNLRYIHSSNPPGIVYAKRKHSPEYKCAAAASSSRGILPGLLFSKILRSILILFQQRLNGRRFDEKSMMHKKINGNHTGVTHGIVDAFFFLRVSRKSYVIGQLLQENEAICIK